MSRAPGKRAWFAPKRYGYGAGLPLCWQGWAMLATHISSLLIGARLLVQHNGMLVAWVALVAVLPMPLHAARTRGGWKWRWGTGD